MSRTTNYNRSNRIRTTEVEASSDIRTVARRILESKTTAERQDFASALMRHLNTAASVPMVNVKISATRQYHKRRGSQIVFKQYGYYKAGTKYIYIQNFTPARGQMLAPKTFLDTLLHEWLHHYDTFKLRLNSIHTAGFYSRLRDLKEKLGVGQTGSTVKGLDKRGWLQYL